MRTPKGGFLSQMKPMLFSEVVLEGGELQEKVKAAIVPAVNMANKALWLRE